MNYNNGMRFRDLTDLLDNYYASKHLLAQYAERVAARTNTPADNRQAAITAEWQDAVTNEIVKRAERGQTN